MPPVRISCYVCGIAFQPRAMVHISDAENEVKQQIAIYRRAENEIAPQEIVENTRICLNCNRSINVEINDLALDPNCLRLNVLKQIRNSSCIFCNRVQDVTRLSVKCRVDVFAKKNIYVPESTRSCPEHLDVSGLIPSVLLQGLESCNRPYRLSGVQLHYFLQGLRELSKIDEPDFNNEESFSEEEFDSISPITREQFRDLYTYCDAVRDAVQNRRVYRRISKKDLMMFLCKLRQGLSDEFLKVIFAYDSRQNVSLIISIVRRSLMTRFVPNNIGLAAITREQYIQRHVTAFANELYNPTPEVPKVIAYIDGTYVYIHKPSNFRALRQTYSIHKGRHLIKPALIVAPDGYILYIHGPYFSDSQNNDASMLNNEFEADVHGLREWFENDHIIVVDRGYRDVLPLLENLGINHKMPPLLGRGQRQFDTEEANDSRLITKTRWIVEARNGHTKSVFKFFGNLMNLNHAINIGDFYRIAGAILNRYRPSVQMAEATIDLAQTMLRRSREPNVVQARVEVDNLHTRNARWVHLNEHQVPHFPILDMNYLKELTVGIYQLNLAAAYIQDKFDRERIEDLELDELADEPGLIRVRVYSRFRRATKYQIWISYVEDNLVQAADDQEPHMDEEQNNEQILGYYCTCKTGARTVGSCAHVASILWYLGYARHQRTVKYPSRSMLNNITNAGHRQQ